jgi:hypothetical protein
MSKEEKMKAIFLLSACLVTISLSVQAGDLYRWVDSSGVVHYSDMPSADVEKVEVMKSSGEVTPSENLPYETRRAQQNFPITLYVSKGCGELCDQARSMLSKRGIPFSENALDTKQDIEAFKQLSGIGNVVPVLAVGKTFLKGFLESQWNNELDFAGYPKTAPYRAPSTPSSSATPAIPTAK